MRSHFDDSECSGVTVRLLVTICIIFGIKISLVPFFAFWEGKFPMVICGPENCPDRASSVYLCSEVMVKCFKSFKYLFSSPCFSIGLSCCYHAKDNLMCRDVCEQVSLF